jgi:hypothetical protein
VPVLSDKENQYNFDKNSKGVTRRWWDRGMRSEVAN